MESLGPIPEIPEIPSERLLPRDAAQALLQLLPGQVPQDVVLVACRGAMAPFGAVNGAGAGKCSGTNNGGKEMHRKTCLRYHPIRGFPIFPLKPLTTSRSQMQHALESKLLFDWRQELNGIIWWVSPFPWKPACHHHQGVVSRV